MSSLKLKDDKENNQPKLKELKLKNPFIMWPIVRGEIYQELLRNQKKMSDCKDEGEDGKDEKS